jgi:hypothetical protein
MNQRFCWWPELRKHYNTAVTGTYCRTGCQWQNLIQQDNQCTYKITWRRIRATIAAVEKEKILLILGVFAALWTQHATRMRNIVIFVLSGTQFFPRYLSNNKIFRKKVLQHEICVLIFSTNLSRIRAIQRRIEGNIFILVHTSSYKVPVILLGFWWNFNFLGGV